MPDEKEIADQLAADIKKGVVSYDRAKRQIEAMGAMPGVTIDVGNVIEWLDKNVARIGYEEEPDENGVVQPLDHTSDYTGSNDDGSNMLEAARQDAIEAKNNPHMVQRAGQPRINVHELAQAQNRVIDVSARVRELTSQADEELGIIDADPTD